MPRIFFAFKAGTVQVDRFVCLESTLTPQGPIYRTAADFFLKGI